MKSTLQTADAMTLPPEVVRVALATALAGAGFGFSSCQRQAARDDEVTVSGNIEVVDAQLGFKNAGRVVERLVSEGEVVAEGQLVARLDDAEQREQRALRVAELAAAEAFLAEVRAGARPQEIAAAEATVRSAEAERLRLELDFARAEDLRAKDVISPRDHELAQAQLRVAQARLTEAEEKLKLVRAGAREETIRQAQARVEQARAALALADTLLENTRLVSALDGVVLSHQIEAGEFVAPGTPVVTVADTRHPWVRAYVAEADLGRVKRGQKVEVRTDSYPGKVYEGTVTFIASEAEFTPKTVQTTKERVTLVFRIKVEVENPDDELKPGMPADVRIPRLP